MESFLILLASIAAGVLLSVFLAKRGTGKLKRRLAGVGVGFVALVVLAGVFNPPPSEPVVAKADTAPADAPAAAAPAAAADPAPEIYRTSARQLMEDYDANEVATDNQMKGKVVEVSGRIASIDKDFMDNVVLQLATGNEFMNASMTLEDSEAGKAAQLAKGQRVTVHCQTMARIMGSPAGDDCVLVE